jgi:hypothetical protein
MTLTYGLPIIPEKLSFGFIVLIQGNDKTKRVLPAVGNKVYVRDKDL